MLALPMDHLYRFNLFSDFSEEQCNFILQHAKNLVVPAKQKLLKLGAKHSNIFFLLEGYLKLTASDGMERIIIANSKSARDPIARLRPSRYQVSSVTEVKIIYLPEQILDKAISMVKPASDTIILENNYANDEKCGEILFDITTKLHTDQLVLPSLPDIALKIRHTVENQDCDADEISKIINMDQSIMAKVLKTANSAIYNASGRKICSTKDAFLRIGAKRLVSLILSYAMKDLFQSDSVIIKQKMEEIWKESIKIAAISSILARLSPGFDPEKALLGGLLLNIGKVAILNNIGNEKSLINDQELLDKILMGLQAEIAEAILLKWDFPEELIDVVKYSTDWYRDEDSQASYSDLVNIAQLHAYIGTPNQANLPMINEIPAFDKLALGQLTPEMSLKVIEKSQDDINQTISMFD